MRRCICYANQAGPPGRYCGFVFDVVLDRNIAVTACYSGEGAKQKAIDAAKDWAQKHNYQHMEPCKQKEPPSGG